VCERDFALVSYVRQCGPGDFRLTVKLWPNAVKMQLQGHVHQCRCALGNPKAWRRTCVRQRIVKSVPRRIKGKFLSLVPRQWQQSAPERWEVFPDQLAEEQVYRLVAGGAEMQPV